ncbi:hypothetical protein VTK73DRAFT_4516 [Phialemonium thermophilum]|uniref:Major facilitator superfamily (MFS) profile domain-containing protein n=1 Tax=Phialemonium thermophilum TaxID=223376 RepID=A0ABR3WTL3_9PEZI
MMQKDKPCESPGFSARAVVASRYADALEERRSRPDRVFYDGEDLGELDPNLVVLSSEARENPRSWTVARKWTVTILVGAYCFLAPFTSTIFAPSLPAVMSEIGETDPVKGALQVGVFLLAFGVAPLFLAPLSEIFGRGVVLRCGNLFFLAFCLGSGFCHTAAQLAVCRFFSGVGGSAAPAVLGGVLADIWDLAGRARASAVLGTAIMLGPIIGPVCGGWMSERASWRWTCWVPAMAAAVLELVTCFTFRESYVPVLLQRKLARSKRDHPEAPLYTVLSLKPSGEIGRRIIGDTFRPIMYLLLDPALSLLCVYFAFIFGVMYLTIVTFAFVFGRGYGHSEGIIGVDLLSEGLGALIGMAVTGKALALVYEKQSKTEYKSETRLICAFPGALLVSGGLFIYGFSAFRTHFIVPLLGMVIFSAGFTNTYLAIQLYIIDSFEYPASAVASLSSLRCLFAGVFPLFGQRLFDALGVDWGVGLLAFLSFGLGLPFLPLIYFYGPTLRKIGAANRRKYGWTM